MVRSFEFLVLVVRLYFSVLPKCLVWRTEEAVAG